MATVHEYIASIGLAFLIYSLPVVAQHSPEYLWQTKAHDNPVLNLALSHQGAFIASIASNGMTHLWNVNNGISVKDFETTTTSHRFGFADYGKPSLTFSLDDKNLAIANSRDMLGFGIDVWNIGDGSLKYRINTSWTPSFAMYSNNGNQIISGEGAYPYFQLSFFNAESGDVESQTSRYYYSRTYFDNIQSVSLSPDGSYIAMCYGYDNDSVPLVMTMTNSVAIRVFNYNVQRCAYSPDGNRIAYCGVNRDSYNDIPGQLLILNPTNLVMERTFIGHQGRAMDLAYSPDGKLLVSCGEDNTIRLWRTGGPCSIIKQKYFELVGTETVTRYRDIQVAEP